MRSFSLRPDDLLTIPGMALSNRLHVLRFLCTCDPSYRGLTVILVGLTSH
jgi:hypothetical protein